MKTLMSEIVLAIQLIGGLCAVGLALKTFIKFCIYKHLQSKSKHDAKKLAYEKAEFERLMIKFGKLNNVDKEGK